MNVSTSLKRPLITVVIPVYNRSARVQPTIDSVLAQTVPADEYELIIIDDGSTDDTSDFIERTYGDNPRVRLVPQENRGVAAARNRGLAEAYGEFIAFLDHDDRWLPEKLEAQVAALKAAPRAAVAYCFWEEVDEQGKTLSEVPELSNTLPTGYVYDALVPRNFIVSMSVPLLRTEAARDAGGFDPETVPCDDWDLWLRLARRYEFICVPRALVLYTRHEEQQSNLLGSMREGMEKTLIKQWPYLLNRPRKLWGVLCLSSFLKSGLLYYEAKAELYEAHRLSVLGVLLRVALSYPLALLSPQWLYLLKRFVTNNRTPF